MERVAYSKTLVGAGKIASLLLDYRDDDRLQGYSLYSARMHVSVIFVNHGMYGYFNGGRSMVSSSVYKVDIVELLLAYCCAWNCTK